MDMLSSYQNKIAEIHEMKNEEQKFGQTLADKEKYFAASGTWQSSWRMGK